MHRSRAGRWTRFVASTLLLLYLSSMTDLRYVTAAFTAEAATAIPTETTTQTTVDLWQSLPNTLVQEPFPETYWPANSMPTFWPQQPALSVPNPFLARTGLEEATVTAAWLAGPAGEPGFPEQETIEGLPAIDPTFTYPLPGKMNLPEGLYTWMAVLKPILPPPPPPCAVDCPPPCAVDCPPPPAEPDLTPFPTPNAPLIVDKTPPAIDGLRHLKAGYLGVAVRDAVSGIAKVEATITGGTTEVIELPEHPLQAVVKLNTAAAGTGDLWVELTVTDWAGHKTTDKLPLHPFLRPTQLGAGAPFPAHSITAGGQPLTVNLVTGNGLLTQTEWTFPALTMQLPLARTYNHQFRQKGMLGWGWRLSLETDLTLYPEQKVAVWYDLSGTEHLFRLPSGSEESPAVVDSVQQPWPRLSVEGEGYRLRFASGEGFRFDEAGRTQEWLDSNGKDRVVYRYNEDDRLGTVLVAGVQALTLSYDQAGLLKQITGTDVKVSYTYSPKGELASATGPIGQTASFKYDEAHRLTQITNPFSQGVDEKSGDPMQPVDSNISLTYKGSNRVDQVGHTRSDPGTDGKPRSEAFLFQPLTEGALQVLTLRDGQATEADQYAKVRYVWDALGRTTALERFIGPYSLKQQFGWDGHDLVSVIDPSGDQTIYTYDDWGGLIKVATPDKWTTEYEITYGPDHRPIQVITKQTALVDKTQREMAVTTTTYVNGRPTKVVGPKGETNDTTLLTYNSFGLLERVQNPMGYVTRYEYDSRGLIAKVTDRPDAPGEPGSAGLSTSRTWDVNGRLLTEQIDLGGGAKRSSTYEYKPGNGYQSVSVTEAGLGGAPATKTTSLYAAAYLPGARPLKVTRAYASGAAPAAGAPASYQIAYHYNSAGLLLAVTEPAAKTVFAYDLHGNQILRQQGPAIINTSYDEIGRPIVISNSMDGYQYLTYGQKGRQVEVREDAGGGRVTTSTSLVDWAGRTVLTQSQVGSEVRYTYDAGADGYLVRMETWEPKAPGSAEKILKRTVDQWSNPLTGVAKKITSGVQMASIYRHVIPDLTKPLVKTEGGTVGAAKPDLVTTQLLDGRGRLLRSADGADVMVETALTYTYDGLGRVLESREPRTTDGTKKQAISTYTYDQFGSVLESKSGLVDGTTVTWDPPQKFTWSLTGAPLTVTPGNDPTMSYKYNEKWQLDKVMAGQTPAEQTTLSATYTDAGYLQTTSAIRGDSSGPLQTYNPNKFGAPLSVQTGDSTWQYAYDGFNRVTGVIDPRGNQSGYVYNLGSTGAGVSTMAATTTNTTSTPDPSADLMLTTINGGYILKRTNPDKTTEQTVYNASGQIIKRIDTLGHETSFTYDAQGRLTSRKDALGKTVSFEYDALGRLTREVDAQKNATTYRYPDPYTTIRTDAGGTETTIKTDVVGRPIKVIDGNGNASTYAYNADGRLDTITSPTGLTSTFKYNGRGELIQIVDPGKTKTTYQVDPFGLVTSIANAKQESESYSYNYQGQVTQHKSYEGSTTTWTYDAAGRVSTKRDPIDGKVEYTYYANGLVKTKTVAGLHVTTYEYDPRDQLTKVTEPGNKVTTYEYDSEGRLKAQTDPELNRVVYDYDAVGRRTLEQFSDTLWIKYAYDANGNMLSKIDSAGGTTTWTYDALNRPTYMSKPDGTWVSRTYDGVGNILTETGPAGTTTNTYTPENRLESTLSPDGTLIEISYDPNGNIDGKKRNGQPLDYDYDDTNRVTKITDDLGYEYGYTYDKDGYVKSITYPNGLVTTIEYDKKHNVISQETKGGAAGVVSTGDYSHENRSFVQGAQEDGRNSAYAYDGRGEMTAVTTPRGDKILYSYDGAGNLTKREAVIGGEWNGKTLTVDELLAMLLEPVKEGEVAPEGAPPADESGAAEVPVATIHGWIARIDLGISDVGYSSIAAKGGNGGGNAGGGNAGGNGNGNAGGNGKGNAEPGKKDPCEHALGQGKGAKIGLYKKCYGEKQTGQLFNLLGIIDNIVNGEYLLPPGDKDDQFAKVREAADGYKILGTTYKYNAQNQLTERTNYVRDEVHPYAYDDRGNLTSNGRITYTWNAQNQLVNVLFPDGEGVRYTYDAQGRRSSRTTYNAQGQGQHVTTYEYEGNAWNVLRERNKDGETTAAYTYDLQGRPLTITYGGEVFWYVFNAHGDVVALTDGTGKVAARYEYDEWGRLFAMYDGEGNQVKEGYGNIGDIGTGPTRPVTGKPTPGSESTKSGKGNGKQSTTTVESTTDPVAEEPVEEPSADELYAAGVIGEPDELVKANPYRYAGYRYDRETQYYYLRTRYYDTRTERFLSRDTWPGEVTNPLTLNRYIYVTNNPANRVDPTGRMECDPLQRSCLTARGTFIDLSAPGSNPEHANYQPRLNPNCTPYRGPQLPAVPVGPTSDQVPNWEQTRFMQFMFGTMEPGEQLGYYGDCTKDNVLSVQKKNGIPVDSDRMIGPRTWRLVTQGFNEALLEATVGVGAGSQGVSSGTTTPAPTPAESASEEFSSPAAVGGVGTGAVVAYQGKTLTQIAGTEFYITGTPKAGMWVPKGGSSSVLFIYRKANPKALYRLDYGFNEATGTINWHHNVNKVASRFPGITNHQVATPWEAFGGRALKVFKWGGRALIVAGLVMDGIEIYYAEDKARAVAGVAGGWAGGAAGAWAGAKGGAVVGGALTAWLGPGAAAGAGVGAVIGGIGGGIAGAIYGKKAAHYVYDRVYTKVEEEEWISLTPEELSEATGVPVEELLRE